MRASESGVLPASLNKGHCPARPTHEKILPVYSGLTAPLS